MFLYLTDRKSQEATLFLENYRVLHSKDLAKVENLLRTVASGELRTGRLIQGGSGFRCNATQASILPIFSLASDIDATFDFQPVDYIRLVFQTHRASKVIVDGREIDVDGQKSSYILPEDRPATEMHPYGYESLAVRIQPAELKQKLSALCNIDVPEKMVFGQPVKMDERFLDFVRKPIFMAARELNSSNSLFHPTLLEEVKAITLTRLLLFAPHNFSALFDARPVAPGRIQMKRAEEYLAANWDKVVDVATLAEVVGVSARTILRYFREKHGETPRDYIRQIRLDRARHMLSSGNETTVISVALTCGFSSLGHFAAAYRQRFGELPSETLKDRQRY